MGGLSGRAKRQAPAVGQRSLWALTALLGAAALALAAGGPGVVASPRAFAGAAPSAPAERAAAPVIPPDGLGPHGVGYRTVTVVDDTRPSRRLTTAVWYPSRSRLAAAGSAGGPAAASYEIAPGVGLRSRVAVAGAALEGGRFPLVVFSHGSAGSRVQFASLAEALASRGYVVAAPDHPGDTMADVARGTQEALVGSASDRPLDVRAVIDWMLCPWRDFGGAVDPAKVAVVGFSFGGLTAVSSTVGFLRAPPDPRVRVVVGISAATEAMPADLMAKVTVPTLLIAGTDDPVTPPAQNADRAFAELTGAADRTEVTVGQATHNSFSDLCAQAYLAADGRVPVGIARQLQFGALLTCVPPLVDPSAARDVARWYTVAYLERYLRGDTRYGHLLTAGAASTLPASVRVRSAP